MAAEAEADVETWTRASVVCEQSVILRNQWEDETALQSYANSHWNRYRRGAKHDRSGTCFSFVNPLRSAAFRGRRRYGTGQA